MSSFAIQITKDEQPAVVFDDLGLLSAAALRTAIQALRPMMQPGEYHLVVVFYAGEQAWEVESWPFRNQ